MKTYSSTSQALRDFDRLAMGEPVLIAGRRFYKTPMGLKLNAPTVAHPIKRPADGRGYNRSRYGISVGKKEEINHE